MLPFHRAFRATANQDGGYDIVDTTTRWVDRVKVERIEVRPGDCLLLNTDGFYRLVDVFRKYDAASLVEAASTRGLDILYDELRELEAKDALCIAYPRAKVSDDAAAALLTVG